MIATAIGTIGLALVAALGLWLSRRATAAAEQATRVAEAAIEHQRALAAEERAASALASRQRFQAIAVMEIAEAFERWISDKNDREVQARIRSRLAALPLDMLELMRVLFDVYPSEHGARLSGSFANEQVALTKRRSELTATLHNLTGVPVMQNFEHAR